MKAGAFLTGCVCHAFLLGAVNDQLALSNRQEALSPQATTDEEAFLIRRIAEFWKDGDFAIVKMQIQEFFEKYPESALSDYFNGILGDLYLQENKAQEAFAAYTQIKDPEIYHKILINKLHCYYELGEYKKLAAEGLPFIGNTSPEFAHRKQELQFLIAEALFREALKETPSQTQISLAAQAKPFYETLLDSPYQEASEFALAEIHRILGDHQAAASLYLVLAEKHLREREDLLFQAATLQSSFAPEDAIHTFSKVIDGKGPRVNEARFNRFVLLFQTEQYRSIIDEFNLVSNHVPESYLPTFHYIVGKSYFSIGDSQNAIFPLSKYIFSQTEPSPQLKNALLIQMTVAQNIPDSALFKTALEKFELLFASDDEVPKAIFMYAMLCKTSGQREITQEKLELINQKYPTFEAQESFLFEYALLAHENGEWSKSHTALKSYLKQWPESPHTEAAWKLFLSSALHKFQDEPALYSKEAFYKDLNRALNNENLFTHEELREYRLLLAKTAYDLSHYKEVLDYTHTYLLTSLTAEKDQEALAEAHYLAALCHHQLQSDAYAFCSHMEQAIQLNPTAYDTATTHLHLYNGYLQNKETVDLGAEHLFRAIQLGGQPVKVENQLWLADHYHTKVISYLNQHWSHTPHDSPEMETQMERSLLLYQGVLEKEGTLILFNESNISLEPELLKYAELQGKQGNLPYKLRLISHLIEEQSAHPDLKWSYKKHALFELAETYRISGEAEKAFETYNFIKNTSKQLPTTMGSVATYESAKIGFTLIDETARTETNPSVVNILNQFKELQIRRNIQSEPIHLEAALTYVEIRSSMLPSKDKITKQLFFLKRIKDEFSTTDDPIARDYHKARRSLPEKDALYSCYMKYIDSEMMRLEALEKKSNGQVAEMEELSQGALALYTEINQSKATPKELHDRVMMSIDAINEMNSY
ncbi:MAG: hypothetical protein KBC64_03265 [Simkaniaceae bacterium]|nr:hypothetical protein [Simkaniaceae bacterium]